jgi:hypothetical protein
VERWFSSALERQSQTKRIGSGNCTSRKRPSIGKILKEERDISYLEIAAPPNFVSDIFGNI